MAKKQEAQEGAKTVKVRVLVDSAWGKCNTLAEIPAELLKSADGEVDASEEAVKAVSE